MLAESHEVHDGDITGTTRVTYYKNAMFVCLSDKSFELGCDCIIWWKKFVIFFSTGFNFFSRMGWLVLRDVGDFLVREYNDKRGVTFYDVKSSSVST